LGEVAEGVSRWRVVLWGGCFYAVVGVKGWGWVLCEGGEVGGVGVWGGSSGVSCRDRFQSHTFRAWANRKKTQKPGTFLCGIKVFVSGRGGEKKR